MWQEACHMQNTNISPNITTGKRVGVKWVALFLFENKTKQNPTNLESVLLSQLVSLRSLF